MGIISVEREQAFSSVAIEMCNECKGRRVTHRDEVVNYHDYREERYYTRCWHCMGHGSVVSKETTVSVDLLNSATGLKWNSTKMEHTKYSLGLELPPLSLLASVYPGVSEMTRTESERHPPLPVWEWEVK